MTDSICIKSPLSGWVSALSAVPDPVFSQGMAGDGVAIEPTGSLVCAPCDGIVSVSPNTPHAISIRLSGGAEILMHIGIDTVALDKQVFKVLVQHGAAVQAGQALLEYDLEAVIIGASSALTPVLITSAGAVIGTRYLNRAVRSGEPLFELHLNPEAAMAKMDSVETMSQRFTVGFGHGFHARPAAQLVAVLRPFSAKVSVHFQDKYADARSMVSVMALGIKQNDCIDLDISGFDAESVLQALNGFFGSESTDMAKESVFLPAPSVFPDDGIFKGVVASNGLAVGEAYRLRTLAVQVPEQGQGSAFERAALISALAEVLRHLQSRLESLGSQQQSILQAHIELIRDPGLRESGFRYIDAGKSAAFAWRQTGIDTAGALAGTDDAYMKERVADLLDLEQQVLQVLAGGRIGEPLNMPAGSIVLADELLPSHLLSMEASNIAGICTSGGGSGAHAAIIAASLGIPLLVAAGRGIEGIEDGNMLILDAQRGELHARPASETVQHFRQRLEQHRRSQAEAQTQAHLPARTSDGVAVSVYANLGGTSEIESALRHGAEGCGLFRTEFLFQDRRTAPDEDEQFGLYTDIAERMLDGMLTIRTMDIGGDKPIPYLALPKEDNPALGLRGIRTSFWRDELFIAQLRAILRVARPWQVRILLPMVNDMADIARALEYIKRCADDLDIRELPKIGIMVETPAAAIMADQLAAAVDFISIGSNDLSQYVLAIDRGHPDLAGKLDALHPAVLRLIRQVADTAGKADRKLSLCGGLASDPMSVPLLLGLGVFELSAVPAKIPGLKALIRRLDLRQCQSLADKALNLGDAVAVRELATEFIAGHMKGESP